MNYELNGKELILQGKVIAELGKRFYVENFFRCKLYPDFLSKRIDTNRNIEKMFPDCKVIYKEVHKRYGHMPTADKIQLPMENEVLVLKVEEDKISKFINEYYLAK